MNKTINLVIPLMGKASRMKAGGYNIPKCLMKIGDKTNLEWGLDSIDRSDCQVIFICRADQPEVKKFINGKYLDGIVIEKEGETNGSLHTVTLAFDYINNDKPLVVFNPDVFFYPVYKPEPEDFQDGLILTFKSNSPNYSYIDESGGIVRKTAEKEVISSHASVGLYCFKSGKSLLDNFPFAPQRNGETFVCPFYNQLINEGYQIKWKEVDRMYIAGTPEEYQFTCNYVLPTFNPKRKFVVCSDHSGQTTRYKIIKALRDMGLEYVDVGAYSSHDCDYTTYTEKAAEYVRQGYFCLASCRSSHGINISLNKHKGVLSSSIKYVNDHQFIRDIRLSIKHNCINSLSLADFDDISEDSIEMAITSILITPFQGGRFQGRVMGVLEHENRRVTS